MAAAAAIKTGAGFIIFRLFLGLCEAGLMPGINFVLGTWYTREGTLYYSLERWNIAD
jgi:MFS family permease